MDVRDWGEPCVNEAMQPKPTLSLLFYFTSKALKEAFLVQSADGKRLSARARRIRFLLCHVDPRWSCHTDL